MSDIGLIIVMAAAVATLVTVLNIRDELRRLTKGIASALAELREDVAEIRSYTSVEKMRRLDELRERLR